MPSQFHFWVLSFQLGRLSLIRPRLMLSLSGQSPRPGRLCSVSWGFANFYRRFIRNFGQVAAPLTALTSTKVPFTWSAQAQEAFDNLSPGLSLLLFSPLQIPNGNSLLRWMPLMSG